jgi:hypothetical protein
MIALVHPVVKPVTQEIKQPPVDPTPAGLDPDIRAFLEYVHLRSGALLAANP